MRILRARLPRDTETIRTLWLAYEEYLHSIDCHDCGGETVAPELSDLEHYYPLDDAGIYLLYEEDVVAGTIAFNRLNEKTAEIRRLYVLPAYEGKGYGRALLEHALTEIRDRGYVTVKLDTFSSQEKPQSLYKTLGFTRCEAYNESPKEKTLFLERAL